MSNSDGDQTTTAKRKQVNISKFFNKKHILSEPTEPITKIENINIPIPSTSQLSENEQNTDCTIENNILEPSTFIDDIGYYTNSMSINQNTKYRLVKKNYLPESDFIYPFSTHVKKGKEGKRFLNQSHFTKFPWLAYSSIKSGLFCKFCVLFLVNNKGGLRNTVPLKKLVTVPLNTFAKLLGKDGDLESHQNNLYHKNAVLQAEEFLSRYEQPEKEVINMIDSERKRQILENRERIRPIIETIIFLARQNIPLRGHRDDGDLLTMASSNTSVINEGNFRELLRFRIKSGDKVLENHLKTTHAKATYISNTIQEEIIECCKEEIIYKILTDIKSNKFYSIIFDETTDVSHSSQMTLVLRYIFGGKIKEDFVSFINCHTYFYNNQKSNQEEQINDNEESTENDENTLIEPKLTGDVLGKTVINILKNLNLNLEHSVGISTDGCSVMTSTVRGAVSKKNVTVYKLLLLIPKSVVDIKSDDINYIAEIVDKEYSYLHIEKQYLTSELELWIAKWTRVKNEGGHIPITVIDGLDHCQDVLFPNIKTLLLIIGCLPISVASAERSFSTLRRLKDWLRSRMCQDRLNGLALLHVHKEKEVSIDNIIERFSKVKKRNMELIM